jgi:hypothetical protein
METRNRRIERYLTFPSDLFSSDFVLLLLNAAPRISFLLFLLPRPTSLSLHAANGRIDQQVKTFKLVSLVGRRWRWSDVVAAVRSEFQVARVTALARSVGRLDMDRRPGVSRTWSGRIGATFGSSAKLFLVILFFHRLFAVISFLIRLLLLFTEPARYFAERFLWPTKNKLAECFKPNEILKI